MTGALTDDGYDSYLRLGSATSDGMNDVLNASSVVAQSRYPEPFNSWIYIPGWDQLVDFESEVVALVGLEGFDPETAAIKWVVVPRPNGGFAASGYCNAVRQFSAMGDYADTIDAEAFEVFRSIVSDEEELAAFGAWLTRSQ